jgi:chromate transporter
MLPGFVLMLLLSWAYLAFGQSLPLAGRAAFGVQAAVGALLVRAIHRLGSHALKDRALLAIAGLAGAAELASVHFLPTLALAGGAYALASRGRNRAAWTLAGALLAWAAVLLVLSPGPDAVPIPPAGEVSGAPGAASLGGLAWSGLKSGLLTFGGAYTVIPFLQHDAVEVHAWMTTSQFLDGLALSSIIPAPLIIFSTFVGYLGAGPAGALVMTAAIFLPAFGFTLLGHGLVERLIERRGLHAFLDGVTAGVIGLMAVTTLRLLRAGVHGPAGLALFAAGLAVLYAWRSKLAVPVVVLAAGAVGLLSAALS